MSLTEVTNMKAIDIDIDRELTLAHQEYEMVKKSVLANQRAIKQCYKKLLNQGSINKETYQALIRIANTTAKFIKMKEI